MAQKVRIGDTILLGLTCLTMLASLYAIFIYAPTEKTTGVVQKIFYFHLPLAFLSFFAFFLVFLASILYLYSQDVRWDIFAQSSAEIGVLFCSLVLITGAIWARPTWNVWWTWDPRLTTALILWFMYVAYLMLRKLLKPGVQTSNIASVFGIISFINVPITFFAIRMWRTIHPVVIDQSGIHISAPMVITLLLSLAAFSFLFVVLLRIRVRVEKVLRAYEELYFLLERNKKRLPS